MKHRAIILAGGNIGNTEEVMARGEALLATQGVEIEARSRIYTSKAWGFDSEQEFANRAYSITTDLSSEALLDTLQQVEREVGRDRESERIAKAESGARYTSRILDLDIILFDRERIATERLRVPHPLVMQRDFAITPLCDLLGCSREELGRLINEIEGL